MGLRPRKGLGQHFLVDTQVLDKIIAAARLAADGRVIEVGPGLGVLTRALARHAGEVVAIEVDPHLADALRNMFAGQSNVRIVVADVLQLEPSSVVAAPYKVVANLPYYIAAPVLRHFLEAKVRPERIVVMVQREVAKRLVARPGDLSLLAISVQFYSRPAIVATVSARSFYPQPRVDSAVVALDVLPRPALDVDPACFFRVVKAGFAAPRKQLRNSLAQGLDVASAQAGQWLEAAGIEPRRRPEELSLEEWGKLCQTVCGEVGTSHDKP